MILSAPSCTTNFFWRPLFVTFPYNPQRRLFVLPQTNPSSYFILNLNLRHLPRAYVFFIFKYSLDLSNLVSVVFVSLLARFTCRSNQLFQSLLFFFPVLIFNPSRSHHLFVTFFSSIFVRITLFHGTFILVRSLLKGFIYANEKEEKKK